MKSESKEAISLKTIVLFIRSGKMIDLTFKFDFYIKDLIRKLEMLWTVTLNDGTVVYSDYDRYEEAPWHRLVKYCRETKLYPVKVKNLMFGAPEMVLLENQEGLDGLFIKRGCIKDIEIDSGNGNSISYKKLVAGVYNPVTNKIDVKKFCWPENELEPLQETRLLTLENLEDMFFIDGQEKDRKKAILLADDRRAM